MQTTTTHPNAELGRRLMDAFNDVDVATIDRLMSDDTVWHQIGGSTIKGKDALREQMTSMMAAGGEDGIRATVHDVVASDDHIIALVDAHATMGGKTFDYRTAEIMHVSDGKVTERWAFSDDTATITKFFSG